MAAITTAIAAAVGTVVLGVKVVHDIKQDKKADKQHKVDMEEQKRVSDGMIEAENKRQAALDEQISMQKEATQKTEEEADATKAETLKQKGQIDNVAARDRQRAIAKGAEGRSDTILTSPLGVTGGVKSKAKKTLLGA